jgi:hypothetical protein
VAARRKSSAFRSMKSEKVKSVDNAVCSPQEA